MRRSRRAIPIAAAIGFLLCASIAAEAADQTDPSFGTNGVAEIPQPSESSGLDVAIWDLANAPGGKMVGAIGELGYGYFAAVRFNENGSLDTSFGNGGFTSAVQLRDREIRVQAQAVAVQKNDKVLVVGYQELDEGFTPLVAPILARYRSDGSLDPSFGHGGKVVPKPGGESRDQPFKEEGGGTLHDVAVEPSGRIVSVGAVDELGGGRPAAMVIAYRPNGRIDTRFGHKGRVLFPSIRDSRYTALRSIKVLKSGKLLVSGYLHSKLFLARLSANGRLDRSFGGGEGKVSIRTGLDNACFRCQFPGALAVDRKGRILVLAEHNVFSPALARFHPDGTLDESFGKHGLSIARTKHALPEGFGLALQRDGRIVVVGDELGSTPEGFERAIFAARRLLPNGRLDRSFGEGGQQTLDVDRESAALTALTQPDGRVVAGGLSLAGKRGGREVATLLMTRYPSGSP